MRASAVRTEIETAITGITTLDSDVGGEAFVALTATDTEQGVLPERAFVVQLESIHPPQLITHDNVGISYRVRVFYGAYEGVEDRMADDAERITNALYSLHSTASSGDLYAVQLGSVDVQAAGEENILEASLPVTVTYRRTGV